jgi:hypothetical protein
MPKSIESNSQIKVPKIIQTIGLSDALVAGIEISTLRKAQAEVPIGNITPFDAAIMEKSNAGVILQNFNGQQLNGVYLRTNSQELGLTKPNQLNINASILIKDNGTQNYQLSTEVGKLDPYVNILNNKGNAETTFGIVISPSDKAKINVEFDSKGNKLIQAGTGITF